MSESKPLFSKDTSEPKAPSGERANNEKAHQIIDLITGKFSGALPEAFFINTGGIEKNSRGPMGYRSTAYSQLSEHGIATGGRTRIIAGAEIARVLPEVKLITNSVNRFDSNVPSMASVNKEELIRRGIDPHRIVMEEDSFSTITQLTEMVRLAVAHQWHRILAMTNEYHLPRMSEMYNRLDQIVDDAEFQKFYKGSNRKAPKLNLFVPKISCVLWEATLSHI